MHSDHPLPLWQPKDEPQITLMGRFLAYIQNKNPKITTYDELYAWSISQTGDFWRLLSEYCDIRWQMPPTHTYTPPRKGEPLSAQWFNDGQLNFAENLLGAAANLDQVVLISRMEGNEKASEYTALQLWNHVAAAAASLRALGLQPGDRVAAVAANCAETVIAMLAVAACGGVWASCSPDFGVTGIVDRFAQIDPKILFFTGCYQYQGKRHRLDATLKGVRAQLSTLAAVIELNSQSSEELTEAGVLSWGVFLDLGGREVQSPEKLPLYFAPRSFSDPLYILFSSGTTGVPKCIVHGVGGTLLQHKKELMLHVDLKPGQRILYYTTCGWMMWNWVVSSLACDATLVTYDGAVGFPREDSLWEWVDEARVNIFGTSPKYISYCMKSKVEPRRGGRLRELHTILSTGSPLLCEHYDWVYGQFPQIKLMSISGGTDIISCFMLGNPLRPIYRGEIQGPGLGIAVECWDESRQPQMDCKGELVCTKPFVSMPVKFWNDHQNSKYLAAYFDKFPQDSFNWYHGDFIEIRSATGGIVVHGRSDATLNPGGVRIGTAEIYRVVEKSAWLIDSIIVARPVVDDVEVILFVKMAQGVDLTDDLVSQLKVQIRTELTPRHVPKYVLAVKDIPYTRSGKKVELVVNRILQGKNVDNSGALANPECLAEYQQWATKF